MNAFVVMLNIEGPVMLIICTVKRLTFFSESQGSLNHTFINIKWQRHSNQWFQG